MRLQLGEKCILSSNEFVCVGYILGFHYPARQILNTRSDFFFKFLATVYQNSTFLRVSPVPFPRTYSHPTAKVANRQALALRSL